jgi:hypothetical protein
MARSEKIFDVSCRFFYCMVALLDLVELDRLSPCDMILLIQDLDRVLKICQI